MFKFLKDLFVYDIGIDLGTANTLIYAKGKGVLLNEPSVITVQKVNNVNKVLAVGAEAKKMLGRTSGNINAIRPMRDGVIADFELAEQMIKYFIRKVKKQYFLKRSTVVVCVPSGSTPVERRAIQDSVYGAGGNKVLLIEEPIAAALGANLPIMDPVGSMVVDIGGGTTEVAVLSLGGIVFSRSARVGGDKMDEAIIAYIKKKYGLNIGEATSQLIKETIGNVMPAPSEKPASIEIKGIDLVTSLPKEIQVNEYEIKEALEPAFISIVDICKEALENTPPELAGDIVEKGIVLTGGGALLKNLDLALSKALQLPVLIALNPLESVAAGTGKALENISQFQHIFTHY
ncbi:rod shape-determining protein [Rickettsiales bacterium LUAb2]